MSIGAGIRSWRVGRALIAVITAYAVAAQTLLIAFAGQSLAAKTADTPPGFELCHHDATGGARLPADAPIQDGCNHCIFCFAGAYLSVAAPPRALFQRVDVEIAVAHWASENGATPRLPAYAIANPRGPPLRANA